MFLVDLTYKEAAARDRGELESCSGPQHARLDAVEQARTIVALLWRIAEEYTPDRVWGKELEQRQTERQMELQTRDIAGEANTHDNI